MPILEKRGEKGDFGDYGQLCIRQGTTIIFYKT